MAPPAASAPPAECPPAAAVRGGPGPALPEADVCFGRNGKRWLRPRLSGSRRGCCPPRGVAWTGVSAASGGRDWGWVGPGRRGAPRRRRAGAEPVVSPAEAVLGEELSELLGAAAPRDEPDVSTGDGGLGAPRCPGGESPGLGRRAPE